MTEWGLLGLSEASRWGAGGGEGAKAVGSAQAQETESVEPTEASCQHRDSKEQ